MEGGSLSIKPGELTTADQKRVVDAEAVACCPLEIVGRRVAGGRVEVVD